MMINGYRVKAKKGVDVRDIMPDVITIINDGVNLPYECEKFTISEDEQEEDYV